MWLVSGLLKDELLLWHPHVYVPWVSPKPHVSCLLKIFPDKAKTQLWTSALHSRCTNRSPHCPQSEPLPRKVVRNKVAKKLLVLWIKNLPPSKVSIRKTHRGHHVRTLGYVSSLDQIQSTQTLDAEIGIASPWEPALSGCVPLTHSSLPPPAWCE